MCIISCYKQLQAHLVARPTSSQVVMFCQVRGDPDPPGPLGNYLHISGTPGLESRLKCTLTSLQLINNAGSRDTRHHMDVKRDLFSLKTNKRCSLNKICSQAQWWNFLLPTNQTLFPSSSELGTHICSCDFVISWPCLLPNQIILVWSRNFFSRPFVWPNRFSRSTLSLSFFKIHI